ncbi:MAG: 16S rRNA (uracil(1498)-N(3))-methyltransferase [Alteromonadaceae bacterium]|nr:MAG: 16S rRNA (uracil(1498)-N(3))-methyltransferase [Alteromonadaceae bacterium]
MNLLLLEPQHWLNDDQALIQDERAKHAFQILKLSAGDCITLGQLGGNVGFGRVAEINQEQLKIEDIKLNTLPPPALPLTLILGMPRPQMLKRILQTVATMGLTRLCLIQSSRVEKSFWQSPSATEAAIRAQLILGLEQGMATQLPEVQYFRRFRPFIEDELTSIAADTQRLIAHPVADFSVDQAKTNQPTTLAIGPEGGFLDPEVERFREAGFDSVHIGSRILKVETAVPVLLAKLYQC